MAEYIEKNAAIRIAERYGLDNGSAIGHHSGIADCIAHEITSVPAADVQPVVHGRWKYDEDAIDWGLGGFVCSVCNGRNDNLPNDKRYNPCSFAGANYCPNCGTKMDKEDEKHG